MPNHSLQKAAWPRDKSLNVQLVMEKNAPRSKKMQRCVITVALESMIIITPVIRRERGRRKTESNKKFGGNFFKNIPKPR